MCHIEREKVVTLPPVKAKAALEGPAIVYHVILLTAEFAVVHIP